MNHGLLSILFSPITLLFLINSFFLIGVTAFAWRAFLRLSCARSLYDVPKVSYRYVLNAVMLLPVLVLGIIIKYFELFSDPNFFPLIDSSLVKYNLLGIIIVFIGLMWIYFSHKKINKKESKISLFIVTYLSVIYLFYLILVLATAVTLINVFHDNILQGYEPVQAKTIHQYLICLVFLAYWLFLYVSLCINKVARICLFIVYTLIISFANYSACYNNHSRVFSNVACSARVSLGAPSRNCPSFSA